MQPLRLLLAAAAAVVAVLLAAALPYQPIFHPSPPGNWVGGPAGPYRDAVTQTAHLYMLYNPSGTANSSTAWYHITTPNYASWTSETPSTAITAGRWYDTGAVLSGVMQNSNQGNPVVMYTCADQNGFQRQCIANPTSADAAGKRQFNTFSKSSVNPVISQESVPILASRSTFRDPTEWWVDPSTNGRWLIALAAQISGADGVHSGVLVFATTDATFQSGYAYSHNLFPGNGTAGSGIDVTRLTLERPDFFTLTGAGATSGSGERFLKLTVADWRRDVVLYGTYAASSTPGPYVFTQSAARRATVVDYGCFSSSKTFYDPVLRRRRIWGYIREELPQASISSNGWAGMLSLRDMVYDTTEKKMRFPSITEMQAMRGTRIARNAGTTVTSAAPVTILAGSTQIPKYQEILATFSIPSATFDGSAHFLIDPPEIGLQVRVSANASNYVAVSLRMPVANATPTRGYRQSGPLLGEVAVADDVDAAASCAAQCLQQVQLCAAWNVKMNVTGSYCQYLAAPTPLVEDCTAQTGRPNVPLLVVNRTLSTSIGALDTVVGRAPLTVAHPGTVELHVFIDDSVIEVYKDAGTEVLTSRVYLPNGGSMTGVSLFTRNINAAITVDTTVFSMISMWTSAVPSQA